MECNYQNKAQKLSLLIIYILYCFSPLSLLANDTHYPAALIGLDPYFSHHVIVAEKSTHKLYLFKNDQGIPALVKTYQMATGKKAGDKKFQGDHRTPEGAYYLTEFLTHQDLLNKHGKQGEIYGVGAFVLNYPNPMDTSHGKTGGGIWLHSTNDETRIEKGLDSRGCIVAANSDLIDISRYIELHRTPIVVVHEMNYLTKDAWNIKREKLIMTIESWVKAWREENVEEYLSFYHNDFYDPKKGNLKQYSNYKRLVFKASGKPSVEIENLNLLQAGKYVMATFKQIYNSNTINDEGRKTLYLKQDEYYNWKIVSERWSKNGMTSINKGQPDNTSTVAFRPSNRFFETLNPKQILGDRLLSKRINNNQIETSNN